MKNNLINFSRLFTKFTKMILIIILILTIAGCNGESTKLKEQVYHNEKYGFSLSIPEDLYKYISVREKEQDIGVIYIDFIYNKPLTDGTECVGTFFRIQVVDKKSNNTCRPNSLSWVGANANYSFYIFPLMSPIEDMVFDKAYKANRNTIFTISDSFTLDDKL